MAVASLLLAFVAAGCNALSSVLQRKANRDEPPDRPFGLRLMLDLIRQPPWLLGGLSMIASFLLQAVALGIGTLAAVEPVLVLELPMTLLLGAIVLRHPLHAHDWISALAMALGLAVFIGVLAPSGGDASSVSVPPAILAAGATVAAIVAMALAAQFGPTRSRSVLFGVAAGTGFGITASLIKIAVTHLSDGGVIGLFRAWETYGLAISGVASVILVQAALHAGTLVAAQPGITLLDPVVALLWGVLVLGETTRTGPILFLAAAGGLGIVIAVFVLARSATHAGH